MTKYFFESLKGDNILADENAVLRYNDINAALQEIDLSLSRSGIKNFSCIGIPAKNTISYTILILYFLSKRINFFFIPAHAQPDAALPAFCDKMAFLQDNFQDIPHLCRSLEFRANSLYVKQKSGMQPGSGTVVVSSSGSTGRPKFICFHSDKLLANAASCADRFRMQRHSRILIPVPLGHMFGLGAGLLPALIRGANICLIHKSNIVKLLDKIAGFRPDITLVTPSLCKMFLLLNKNTGRKQTYITAGERIKKDVYVEFETRYGLLVNLYGCTEMGAMATSDTADSLGARADGYLSPLKNVEINIASTEKGEVLCRHQAAFEYYIDEYGNHAGQHSGSSWYHTNDLGARITEDRFVISDRIDNCVNRSGFLVSLQEIASSLENVFAEISQAIVLENKTDTIRGAGLVAVCELKKGRVLAVATARTLCKNKMPGHWIPDQFYVVDELPRLANGKPDRLSLSKMYSSYHS